MSLTAEDRVRIVLLQQAGERAHAYYSDMGVCLFCDASDALDRPHHADCEVGKLATLDGATD